MGKNGKHRGSASDMTFIDFFSGIGGIRLGMEMAGHECVGFCEYDKYAVMSYVSMHLLTEEQRSYLEGLGFSERQKEILKDEYRNGLVNDNNLELLKKIKLDQVHFAWDRWQDKDVIEPKLREFARKTGYHRGNARVTVFILTNFDTTLEQDIYRIQLCRELNFSPYPMIYDKAHCDPVYKKLQRWCNNFIFWKVPTFEEYIA